MQKELKRSLDANSTFQRAQLITSNLHQIPSYEVLRQQDEWPSIYTLNKEQKESMVHHLSLADYDGSSKEVELKIFLFDSAGEEARALFKSSKRLKNGEPKVMSLLSSAHSDIAKLSKFENLFFQKVRKSNTISDDDLQELLSFSKTCSDQFFSIRLLRTLSELQPKSKAKSDTEEQASSESKIFRKFEAHDGTSILVGKSRSANDELTMRIAKPHDLFLHVEGFSGSHVIVRMNDNQSPRKSTLQAAADLAARFSSAGKNGGKFKVTVAERRNVRKKKGLPVGAVLVVKRQAVLVGDATRAMAFTEL